MPSYRGLRHDDQAPLDDEGFGPFTAARSPGPSTALSAGSRGGVKPKRLRALRVLVGMQLATGVLLVILSVNCHNRKSCSVGVSAAVVSVIASVLGVAVGLSFPSRRWLSMTYSLLSLLAVVLLTVTFISSIDGSASAAGPPVVTVTTPAPSAPAAAASDAPTEPAAAVLMLTDAGGTNATVDDEMTAGNETSSSSTTTTTTTTVVPLVPVTLAPAQSGKALNGFTMFFSLYEAILFVASAAVIMEYWRTSWLLATAAGANPGPVSMHNNRVTMQTTFSNPAANAAAAASDAQHNSNHNTQSEGGGDAAVIGHVNDLVVFN